MKLSTHLSGPVAAFAFATVLSTPPAKAAQINTYSSLATWAIYADGQTEASQFADRSTLTSTSLTFGSLGGFNLGGFNVVSDPATSQNVLNASSSGTLLIPNGSFLALMFVLDSSSGPVPVTFSFPTGDSVTTTVNSTPTFFGFVSDTPLTGVALSGPVNLVDAWSGPLDTGQGNTPDAPEPTTWLLTAGGLASIALSRKVFAR